MSISFMASTYWDHFFFVKNCFLLVQTSKFYHKCNFWRKLFLKEAFKNGANRANLLISRQSPDLPLTGQTVPICRFQTKNSIKGRSADLMSIWQSHSDLQISCQYADLRISHQSADFCSNCSDLSISFSNIMPIWWSPGCRSWFILRTTYSPPMFFSLLKNM